jgi:hypothetical protein
MGNITTSHYYSWKNRSKSIAVEINKFYMLSVRVCYNILLTQHILLFPELRRVYKQETSRTLALLLSSGNQEKQRNYEKSSMDPLSVCG